MIDTLIKQPGETLRHVVRFSTIAPIVAVAGVTITPRGLVPGAPALAADVMIAEGIVTASLSSGGDGERYAVQLVADDATGARVESEIEVVLIETVWATPDGGAPYLSIGDFIRRAGLPEVVRMTDVDGSGRIDRDLLIEALTDAQAEAEVYLAGRYALPLATVPRIVAMAIADRARMRLYPDKAPEGIETLAKNALRMLEKIGDGTVKLGLPSGEAPADAPTETPILISPGRRQYPHGLVDY